MAGADTFRDSTQILVPAAAIDDVEDELDERFTLTMLEEGPTVRIIGSPVEIKDASDFLAMRGITVA